MKNQYLVLKILVCEQRSERFHVIQDVETYMVHKSFLRHHHITPCFPDHIHFLEKFQDNYVDLVCR